MLKAMDPEHGAQPPEKWQQRKSAQTRTRLIDAGIDALVDDGYAGLTTAAVAVRCGLSRGAMHHHFATRMDIVAAVCERVLYERMSAFLEDYLSAVVGRGDDQTLAIATAAHWRTVNTREYAAFLHLAVAARGDCELDAVFRPVVLRYDDVWTREMIQAFPQWKERWDMMLLASDFISAAHIGMLVNKPVIDQDGRIDRLRDLLVEVIGNLHDRR